MIFQVFIVVMAAVAGVVMLDVIGPLGAVITAVSVLAVFGVVIQRRSRRGPGMCDICGYDLRGSIDRCPECGHAKETAKPGASRDLFTGPRSIKTLLLAIAMTTVSLLSPWPPVTGPGIDLGGPIRLITSLGWPLGYIRVVNGEITDVHWFRAAVNVFFWFMIANGVIYFGYEYLKNRDLHRIRGGQCSACGYDLRGSPHACPECGQTPEAAK